MYSATTATDRPVTNSSISILRWLSSSPKPLVSNATQSQLNIDKANSDLLEKVFIGMLGGLIGAIIMTVIFFILLLYYQRRCRKRKRPGTGTHETSRTTITTEDMSSTDMEEAISSTDSTSQRSSHLQVTSSAEDLPKTTRHSGKFQFYQESQTKDLKPNSRHQHNIKKLTVKKNQPRRFRTRPPKPTPRMRLSRKLVSRLLSSKSCRSYAVQSGRSRQCSVVRKVSTKEEKFDKFENRKTKVENHGKIRIPSVLFGAIEDNELSRDDWRGKPRLRSNSDPRDQRYHNYVNYPIRSAPERIRDDSMLDTKLYIAETLSNCSSHDYVNLMAENTADISRNRIVQKGKKRPRKPPRYFLNYNSRKIVPAKITSSDTEQGQIQVLHSGEFPAAPRFKSLNSPDKVPRDNSDVKIHVDIDELQGCFHDVVDDNDDDDVKI